MVSENEFKRNRNTIYLASLIMDDFYSKLQNKLLKFGDFVPDCVNQKQVYQIDLNYLNEQNNKTGFQKLLEFCGNPFSNSFDFNELNEIFLKEILKKSINIEDVVIKNGILSLI